jgi:hypothetical protein
MPLAKLVAGGASVTVTDMRPLEGIQGTKLIEQTVNPLAVGNKDTVAASLGKNAFFSKWTRG